MAVETGECISTIPLAIVNLHGTSRRGSPRNHDRQAKQLAQWSDALGWAWRIFSDTRQARAGNRVAAVTNHLQKIHALQMVKNP